MDTIKIIATPPGDAAQQIREAWVGVRLPLLVPSLRTVWMIGDVVTSTQTYVPHLFRRLLGQGRRETGYLVSTVAAISVLRRANPSAADWWRENAPDIAASGAFLFSTEVCELVEREIASTYYHIALNGCSAEGVLSIKTSWYDEFGTHMTGLTKVKPDTDDYQLWQWLIQRSKSDNHNAILSADALDALRTEFNTTSASGLAHLKCKDSV